MVEWMGYPFEEKYKEAEEEYLELENKMTLGKIPKKKTMSSIPREVSFI